MAKKQETAAVAVPDLPKVPIIIGGKTYNLCFDMDALADAEEFFIIKGERINLLRSLSSLSLKAVRAVFACAVHTHHPDLTFQEAKKLLTVQSSIEVAVHVVEIWNLTAAA